MEKVKADYIASGIVKSLSRNRHMNEYAGEPVDLQKAEGIVSKLAQQLTQDLEPRGTLLTRGNIADWCCDFGKNFHKSDMSKDFSLSEKTRDAVVVDFLNYVCMKQCLDLGMYTADLQKVAR